MEISNSWATEVNAGRYMELDSGDMMARKETRTMMEAFSRGEKVV
jgi:hypothetical protein